MIKKVLKKTFKIIVYILIGLSIFNTIESYFIPVMTEYSIKSELYLGKNENQEHADFLGTNVNLEAHIYINSIYNFDYYSGTIKINNIKEFKLGGKDFRPRTFLGKRYIDFKFAFSPIKPRFDEIYINIVGLKGYEAKICIVKRYIENENGDMIYSSKIINLSVYKNGQLYSHYSENHAKK